MANLGIPMAYEHCCLCNERTGRAGRHEDSIFISHGKVDLGPLCEECRDDIIEYVRVEVIFDEDTVVI